MCCGTVVIHQSCFSWSEECLPPPSCCLLVPAKLLLRPLRYCAVLGKKANAIKFRLALKIIECLRLCRLHRVLVPQSVSGQCDYEKVHKLFYYTENDATKGSFMYEGFRVENNSYVISTPLTSPRVIAKNVCFTFNVLKLTKTLYIGKA